MGLEKARQHARQSGSKAEKKSKPRKDFGGYTFINVNPSKADALQAKQAFENGELEVGQIFEWAERGFDFSLKFVPDSEGYKATFTDMREGSATYKAQLRLDASNPTAAALKALFFMEFRFDSTWTERDRGETDAEDWF